MKLGKIGKLACVTLALSIGFEGVGLAQSRRPASIGSLLEMKCYGKGIFAMNRDGIVINRRPYTAVGLFSVDTSYDGGVSADTPIEVSCDLAGRNRSPMYNTLTMTVGSNERSGVWYSQYSKKLRLTTYIDGRLVDSSEIGFGALKRFSLDINGSRSVAFSVECLKPASYEYCPSLWILEDKLIQ